MKNQELLTILAGYPADMEIKIMIDHNERFVNDMDSENILHTSDTAHIDTSAPEEEWDNEDGKASLGDGQQYLLINPIIL